VERPTANEWRASEKSIARRVFEEALLRELAAVVIGL
jgi:hypothetical protein